MGNAALFRRYYHDRPDFTDGTTRFHDLIGRYGAGDRRARVLELGPTRSPSLTTRYLKGRYEHVVGLDVDRAALGNPLLDEVRLYDGGPMPFDDSAFDLVVSDYVNEHVTNPRQHVTEVARILRFGGVYAVRTPQILHYVVLASRAIPRRFHPRIATVARRLDDHEDAVFPAVYRANRRSTYTRRVPRWTALRPLICEQVECEPSYAFDSRVLFYLGLAYERIVNRLPFLGALRSNLFVVLRKEQTC